MTLESPSRVRSYKEREEGRKKRVKRDKAVSVLKGKKESLGARVKAALPRKLSAHASCCWYSEEEVCGCVSIPLIVIVIMHSGHMFLSLLMPPTPCHHMTHRAWYVRAGCPLAIRPGCRRTSDLLLLPQQLAVLLLSVLHIDQQRDEAVLHLFFIQTEVLNLCVSRSNCKLFLTPSWWM